MLVKHETVIEQRNKTQICILNTFVWNKVLKSLKVIASSGLDKITLRIHNQSGTILCTVCMGWHSHWEQRAGLPSRAQSQMPDVVSRSSKCLSSLVTISFYDPTPLIGLVRALKILPLQNFSYKISIHITVEIKRDFWRYLVQLSVQAESPRAGCSGPPTVTFGYLQKWIFYSLSSLSVPVLAHSHSKKRWFFMVRSLY